MISNFLLATTFSFLGSIPPGTINLSMLQIGLRGRIGLSWRFAVAAAAVEYPYAWAAITLESYIVSSPMVIKNLQLIGALVMITLGVLNLWSVKKPSRLLQKMEESGFRRGLILGVLNPMALPFWVGITTYLDGLHWIDLSAPRMRHAYLLGVSIGALGLLMLLAYAAKWVVGYFGENARLKLAPGIALISLGAYSMIRYWM